MSLTKFNNRYYISANTQFVQPPGVCKERYYHYLLPAHWVNHLNSPYRYNCSPDFLRWYDAEKLRTSADSFVYFKNAPLKSSSVHLCFIRKVPA
jgi:hypothetical protein